MYRPDPFHRDTSLDFYGYNDPPIRNFVSYLPSNDTSTQVVSTHSDILSLTPDKALAIAHEKYKNKWIDTFFEGYSCENNILYNHNSVNRKYIKLDQMAVQYRLLIQIQQYLHHIPKFLDRFLQ